MNAFDKTEYKKLVNAFILRLFLVAIILSIITIVLIPLKFLYLRYYFLYSVFLTLVLFLIFDLIYIRREFKTKRFVPNLLSLLALVKMLFIFIFFFIINKYFHPNANERISFVSHLIVVYFSFKSIQTHFLVKKIRFFKQN